MKYKHLIECTSLSKVFVTGDIKTLALDKINLRVKEREFIAVEGPSGCGKSTLLSILGLLEPANSGSYKLAGIDVRGISLGQKAAIRNRYIGYIFQEFNLIPELSVYDNIKIPLIYSKEIQKTEINDRIYEVLNKMNMSHRSKHRPSQLSGGQQQRVAIARALVTSPKLIIADEPTGNLDSTNAKDIMNLLCSLNYEHNVTIVMVTHNHQHAQMAHRIIRLHDGTVINDSEI